MKLRPNAELASDLGKIIKGSLRRTTDKLNQTLPILNPKKPTLDTWFSQTVDKTKFIAPIFNDDLECVAKELGIDYIQEEAVGYDAILREEEIENKLSLTSQDAAFSTGNNHSKTKVDKVFCTRLRQEGNVFTEVFACIVDLSLAKHEDTRWYNEQKKDKDGNVKNNNGFATLKVHKSDTDCVTIIHGNIHKAAKFLHPKYEVC
jgi:hypothetical protein|tara:strand:+ start:155 stop:766 length:612 start_codon:yes stop_codon:yes gene_type:complete